MDMLRVSLFVTLLMHCTAANKLLLVLLDGFRWDYFDHPALQLKGFPRLIRNGVKAEYMVPDFPTNSFPNYRTIETGLHVETHGFVGNFMYDVETKMKFFLTSGDTNDPSWYDDAEAFYVTGEKQGVKSSLYYWRGCQVPQSGWKASHCVPWYRVPTFKDTEWALKDGLDRIQAGLTDIVYIYHEQIDKYGHVYGPNSPEVLQAIREIDQQIDTLLDDIETRGLEREVDLMVISDHGMTNLDVLHVINVTHAINMDDVHEIIEAGTQSYIWPREGKEREVYEALKDYSPHLKVFYKDELQDRWFIKKHKRIPPIYLYAEPGWYIVHPKSNDVYYEPTGTRLLGNHGFDNNKEDMRSIFLAHGPSFKKGYVAKPFSNVNVYQVVCHVTDIAPRKHNGTWSDVRDFLDLGQDTSRNTGQGHVEL